MAQTEVNRLYWLGRNGLWKLVMECQSEAHINMEVSRKMGASTPKGIKGYSRIVWPQGDVFWYEHKYCGGSFTRSILDESIVPKPIRLLELLRE